KGDLLKRLVERTLEERGINGEEWTEAGAGQTGHHVEGVALADPGIPGTIGETRKNLRQPRAVRHGGGGGYDPGVALHEIEHRITEGAGKRTALALQLDAAILVLHGPFDLEGRRRVKLRTLALAEPEA